MLLPSGALFTLRAPAFMLATPTLVHISEEVNARIVRGSGFGLIELGSTLQAIINIDV